MIVGLAQEQVMKFKSYNRCNFKKLFSDFFVEDACRIQNIQLGYTIPTDIVEKVGISKFRIYGSVNNAFTFSKYKVDPAATTGDAIGGGIDPGFYPVTRQYLLDLIFHFKIEHDENNKNNIFTLVVGSPLALDLFMYR